MDEEENTSLQEPLTPLELVTKTFAELGFTNENPEDLQAVTELLEMWRDKDFDDQSPDFEYTQEQYILLNDPDVLNVLNKCKQYYEPKRHLSKGDLRTILENIALGKLTRQDYDFKNGAPVTIEPSFTERIQAIKMLQDDADDENKQATVQFINNIVGGDVTIPKPNLDAPEAPPENHYSLKLVEPSAEDGDN